MRMKVTILLGLYLLGATVVAAGGAPHLSCSNGWDIGGVEVGRVPSADSAVSCASVCLETPACHFVVHFLDGTCALRTAPWTKPSQPSHMVTQACSVRGSPLGMPQAVPEVFHPGNLPSGSEVLALCAQRFSVHGITATATFEPSLADCVGRCKLAGDGVCIAVEYDNGAGKCRLLRSVYDSIENDEETDLLGTTGVSELHTVCSLGSSRLVLQLHGESKITVNGLQRAVRAHRVLAGSTASPPPLRKPPSPSPPVRSPPRPPPPSPLLRPPPSPPPRPPPPRPPPRPPPSPPPPPPQLPEEPSSPSPPDNGNNQAPVSQPNFPPSWPNGPSAPNDPYNPCPVAGRPASLTTYRCAAGWEVKGTLLASQPTGTYTAAQCEALCVANAQCQFYVSYLDGKCSLRYNPWTADLYNSAPAPGVVNITCSKPGATQPLKFPQAYQTCMCQSGWCYGIANCVEGFEAYGEWGFFSTSVPNGYADMGMCMVGCLYNPHLCSYALWYQNGTDILCLARQKPYIYPTPMPDYYNVQGTTGPSKRANIMCEVANVGSMYLDAGRPNP